MFTENAVFFLWNFDDLLEWTFISFFFNFVFVFSPHIFFNQIIASFILVHTTYFCPLKTIYVRSAIAYAFVCLLKLDMNVIIIAVFVNLKKYISMSS